MVPTDRRYLDYIGSQDLTDGDVARINNMYECYGRSSSPGQKHPPSVAASSAAAPEMMVPLNRYG